MQKIVLITGGFDPVHSGHISYIKSAAKLGDRLIVGVNSDSWIIRKKGRPFMTWSERAAVVGSIQGVDHVIEFDDFDGSARHAIKLVRAQYPEDTIVFCNGGDRDPGNIAEIDAQDPNLRFEFGVGGDTKINSSSWLLEDWKAPKTARPWGHYRVIYEQDTSTKVKELVVEPRQSLSMQRHQQRAEHWFVVEGTATVYTLNTVNTDAELLGAYHRHESLHIPAGEWHQLVNETDQPLRIVEIQYGTDCVETDIERLSA